MATLGGFDDEEFEEDDDFEELPPLNRKPSEFVPSQDGVLSSHAAEFWFPECRDCTCCQGYKHGCKCRKAGREQCYCSEGASSTTAESVSEPQYITIKLGNITIEEPLPEKTVANETTTTVNESTPTTAINETTTTTVNESTTPTALNESTTTTVANESIITPVSATPVAKSATKRPVAEATTKKTAPKSLIVEAPADSPPPSNKRLPSGAVPSQNGVLSSRAAEFWFPECRDCSCCKGYKHGCDCCRTGKLQCFCTGDNTMKKPCQYFKNGYCRSGDKCQFSHS